MLLGTQCSTHVPINQGLLSMPALARMLLGRAAENTAAMMRDGSATQGGREKLAPSFSGSLPEVVMSQEFPRLPFHLVQNPCGVEITVVVSHSMTWTPGYMALDSLARHPPQRAGE